LARAVLFDLDGTVWDSWPWYAQLLHARGAGSIEAQRVLLECGEPAAALLRGAGLSASAFKAACASEPPPLYGGIAEAIQRLGGAGVRLGAVTNLPKWLYAPMLAAHSESLTFETVIGWNDARRKPRPDALELAMDRLGVEPAAEHWYVGDTASDAQATVAAGMSFAWARWGYGPARPDGTSKSLDRPRQAVALA
jgi:HAD superfamily hydrolase (TIGR01509 family)